MKATIFEHAERHLDIGGDNVMASGKSIAIVGSKVCAIKSGGRLAGRSDGGADDYCSVFMDSGQEFLVCGTPEVVGDCLGVDADV